LDKHHHESAALADASSRMGTAAEALQSAVKVNEVFREGDPLKQIIAESQQGHGLMVVVNCFTGDSSRSFFFGCAPGCRSRPR
jgi:hypothetical protein